MSNIYSRKDTNKLKVLPTFFLLGYRELHQNRKKSIFHKNLQRYEHLRKIRKEEGKVSFKVKPKFSPQKGIQLYVSK